MTAESESNPKRLSVKKQAVKIGGRGKKGRKKRHLPSKEVKHLPPKKKGHLPPRRKH